MKDNRFYEGQKLACIFWEDGSIDVGKNECKEIVVVMENGEMDLVPWAMVTKKDGSVWKYSLKQCQGVKLL